MAKELSAAKFIQYDSAGHTQVEEIPEATAHDADLFLVDKAERTNINK